jgi:hypothetical protein
MFTLNVHTMFQKFLGHFHRSRTLLLVTGLLISLSALNTVHAATITVPPNANLQDHIDAAQPGDELVLPTNGVYVGPITLKLKSGSAYIIIRSAASNDFPEGTRVSPGQRASMPKIVSAGSNEPALLTEPGAHHYRLIGIEFMPTSNSELDDLILLGGYGPNQNTSSQVPHHITIDRCYIHGLPGVGLKRGIALNSADTKILNSYISDFKDSDQDSQAICGWNGPGPFEITNSYLEAAGENVMFGGADPSIPDLVPSNILINRNHFAKNESWKTSGQWVVKNLLELKNARTVTIENNLLEYCWRGGQDGYAVLFTPRNQDNTADWSVVRDVTFQNNIVRHAAGGMMITGSDDIHPSEQTRNITVYNNLFYDINGAKWGEGPGWFLKIGGGNKAGGIVDLKVDHNTSHQSGRIILVYGTPNTRFIFTNNITPHNDYGIFGDAIGFGNPAIQHYFPASTITKNVIAAQGNQPGYSTHDLANRYPPGNYFIATLNEVGFVNPAVGDYRLASRLPDGNLNPYRTSGTNNTAIGYAHPLEDARAFVRQHYLDFLRRTPDAAGWDFWTDNINLCYDPSRRPAGQTEAQCLDRQRETTSGAFFLSPEFQYTGSYVYRIYKGSLGRWPVKATEFDPDQITVATGIIANGQLYAQQINTNKQNFAAQFVTRPAFTAIYGNLNNTQYVDKLSETTGVPLTTGERNELIGELNANPNARGAVLYKIVDGIHVISEGNQQFMTRYGQEFYKKEFNAAFVFMQYLGYLQRDPDLAGYQHWLGKLIFYGNYIDAEMVRSFIISPEYLSRFGAPDIGYVGKPSAVVLEQSSVGTFREEKLTWTNAVGVTVSGSGLTSTATGWGTSGAGSTAAIVSGDGFAEFTATETSTCKMFGLSRGDTDQNFTDIDFAIYLAYGSLYVYEAGVYKAAMGTYAVADRLRVAVEGGQVKYKKNGATLYISSVAPVYPLLVDTALYHYGATITDARLVGRLDHGVAAGSVPFYTGFEMGQRQPDWFNSADYIANVTGYCCGLTSSESTPRGEAARLGAYALMYSGNDTSAGGPSYSYNKVFDVNLPVKANTELSYWIYPQAVGGNNSAYVSIDLFCTDGSSLRDSGAVDQWGVRVHPAYQGAGGRLALNQWNLVRSNIGTQLAGKTIYRIYVAYDQPQNSGLYRGYIDDISIVDRIP